MCLRNTVQLYKIAWPERSLSFSMFPCWPLMICSFSKEKEKEERERKRIEKEKKKKKRKINGERTKEKQ